MKIEALTAEIVEIYRSEIAQLYFENVRSNAFHNHYTYEEAFEKIGGLIDHLKTDTAIAYGALKDDELIAFIWAYVHQFREETRMYVSEIRVKKEHRKHGIGKKLLKLVEDKAREQGLSAIYLHAEAENIDSRKLYEEYGYTEERIQLRKGL